MRVIPFQQLSSNRQTALTKHAKLHGVSPAAFQYFIAIAEHVQSDPVTGVRYIAKGYKQKTCRSMGVGVNQHLNFDRELEQAGLLSVAELPKQGQATGYRAKTVFIWHRKLQNLTPQQRRQYRLALRIAEQSGLDESFLRFGTGGDHRVYSPQQQAPKPAGSVTVDIHAQQIRALITVAHALGIRTTNKRGVDLYQLALQANRDSGNIYDWFAGLAEHEFGSDDTRALTKKRHLPTDFRPAPPLTNQRTQTDRHQIL